MQRRGVLSVICAFVFLLSAPQAHAGLCADFLSGLKKYARDVRDTKGLRLIALPRTDSEKHDRGNFAPFSGLNTVLIEKPADLAVRVIAGPEKRSSLLAKMPFIIGWALMAQIYVIDPVTDWAMNERIEHEITQNKLEFQRLIANDYRFEPIRRGLAEGELTEEEAERQAYMISRAYSSYYKFRDGKKAQFELQDNLELLDHYLFAHLKPVIEGPVSVPSGFRAGAAHTLYLSDESKQRLFHLTHRLYLQYQIIEAYVAKNQDPALAETLRRLHEDEFTQELRRLLAAKRIGQEVFRRALQERAFWAYRLECYQVMGLEKLHPETGQPVTQDDYDTEILSSL